MIEILKFIPNIFKMKNNRKLMMIIFLILTMIKIIFQMIQNNNFITKNKKEYKIKNI
jgi:hypothetical protein